MRLFFTCHRQNYTLHSEERSVGTLSIRHRGTDVRLGAQPGPRLTPEVRASHRGWVPPRCSTRQSLAVGLLDGGAERCSPCPSALPIGAAGTRLHSRRLGSVFAHSRSVCPGCFSIVLVLSFLGLERGQGEPLPLEPRRVCDCPPAGLPKPRLCFTWSFCYRLAILRFESAFSSIFYLCLFVTVLG